MRQCPCAHKQKRQHFHAKTTSAKLYIYIGVGSRDLFIDEAHTALGIFPVFFPCMLPTPLCDIFFIENNYEGKDLESKNQCVQQFWLSKTLITLIKVIKFKNMLIYQN